MTGKGATGGKPSHAFLCRPECCSDLADELTDAGARVTGSTPTGIVTANLDAEPGPFVFERQRLSRPSFLSNCELQPVTSEQAAAILEPVLASDLLWTTHVYTSPTPRAPRLSARAEGIAAAMIRMARKQRRDIEKRFRPPQRLRREDGLVVQFCLDDDGLWTACTPLGDMACQVPGGIFRMKFDDLAPSRSYLKIEEAFVRMTCEPVERETAIDLGAAPGGWSYAFLKRDCRVTAVDHGPMKLDGEVTAHLTHLMANGITYQPDKPVDWLAADMLIPPGVALGLLRRWFDGNWMRRAVVNVKLPQQQCWPAIKPVLIFLRGIRGWNIHVRQLYHDRREVTVMAVRTGQEAL